MIHVGNQLGGVPYTRMREQEFGGASVPRTDLLRRVESLQPLIPDIVASLTQTQLDSHQRGVCEIRATLRS
jgi:hypothetical protein